jgi:hypothetical protein
MKALQAQLLGYGADAFEVRMPLADSFSILLELTSWIESPNPPKTS